ncbi:uncharacterized protein LAESUDRAFT_794224 [Laetiporus sulphureus 93-53]|uniref:Zn(2)-C6 fungal-type domain-containing protein n=1 Tax=Laetiporus sulphureus 93-53 TaxID=1314785 RepID=A0A165C6C8_9APHY|nr:uncharacterized protein LAESUDRAFT_794224 [Laetiporus sulphureus 93-53]KZT02280.1 hypothetical protein LAESUDRAFT_794224 [Laetiporus sulphureus 93-53]
MADNSQSSPGGGGHSPSPENYPDVSSSNASPISVTSALSMSHAPPEGAPSGQSAAAAETQTPMRSGADVTRSSSGAGASKGGCWTCRLRRKRCDEEQEVEGGPCKMCRRLGLKCLGWGARRPDWMRDKEKVARYRAEIKEFLTRQGKIRGQPRTAYMQRDSPYNAPTTTLSGPSSVGRYSPLQNPRHTRSLPPSRNQLHTPGGAPSMAGMHSLSVSREHNRLLVRVAVGSMSHGVHYTQPMSPVHPMQESFPTMPFFPYPLSPTIPPNVTSPDLTVYYFQYVRQLQFVFADDSLTKTLYSIVLDDPDGPVANAICALSSLHYTCAHSARQLHSPNLTPEQTMAEQYYDHARQLLHHQGQYSDTDAVAAVQLASFRLFAGRSCAEELEIACEWLVQTRISEEQNPKLTLMNMDPRAKFAAKATMWLDVLVSITLMQPPRFFSLYRRLFGDGGAGFWAGAHNADSRMDALTGCPDEAMLALAEISALAYWKEAELREGKLSVRELVQRGEHIEAQLRQRSSAHHAGEGAIAPLEGNLAMNFRPPMAGLHAEGSASTSASASSVGMGQHVTADSREEARRVLVADIFRETAALYLHTVLNNALPGVLEIRGSVEKIMMLLNQLTPSEFDRALMLPLYLVGCLSGDLAVHGMVARRLQMLSDAFGYHARMLGLMESMWHNRNTIGGPQSARTAVPWCETLKWAGLLLL